MISISTMLFQKLRLGEAIRSIAKAGFNCVEISHVHLERYDSKDAIEVRNEVSRAIEGSGVKVAITHLPADRLATVVDSADDWVKCLARVVPFIEALRDVGIEIFVVHTLMAKPRPSIPTWKALRLSIESTRRFLEKLDSLAKDLGIRIAVENRVERYAYGNTLADLIEVTEGLEFTKLCIDVGHANASGLDPVEMVRDSRDLAIAYHLHDNDGSRDQHLPPYLGSIPWNRVIPLLNPKAMKVLEVSCSSNESVCSSYARYLMMFVRNEMMNLQRAEE